MKGGGGCEGVGCMGKRSNDEEKKLEGSVMLGCDHL